MPTPKFAKPPAPQPLVFLDVDGVLNHKATFKIPLDSAQCWVPDRYIGDRRFRIDAVAVCRLNHFVALGAKFVLSSSWRKFMTPAELTRAIECLGFQGRIESTTPVFPGSARGYEISRWLADHGIEHRRFVILDDEEDMVHLSDRLVRTSFEDGLQDHHVTRAFGLLVHP